MESLLSDLQTKIKNSEIPVSELLMDAKVVARKLNTKEFEEWIDYELKGYPIEWADHKLIADGKSAIPQYRKIRGSFEYYNGLVWIKPKGNTENEQRIIETYILPEPVSYFESMIKENHNMFFLERIINGKNTKLSFAKTKINTVLSKIRAELLNWTLNLDNYVSEIKNTDLKSINTNKTKNTSSSILFKKNDFLIDDSLIFILSPFSEPFNKICKDYIKPIVESFENMRGIRADDIYNNEPIIEDIWKSINESRIIIAELTGRNPNVFYELGIAHALGKEVILLTQNENDVPFDIKHIKYIIYENSVEGVKKLENDLKQTIKTILKRT
ncbi:hypothetical protein HNP93_001354 [Methanococcus maripaludis]|uniref:AbiTii domain-containing protein n=1 Tax=Methanococcus maripaludis TaxID=39152 RepID=A0A7J9P607_METMI|nr:hypothetical protein [Methanococcus maripaludis]MBA2858653.1 hypothetical protein [Methanococcus maripaludis]